MNFVLCVDDTPERYKTLAQMLSRHNIFLVITCRVEEVEFYLQAPHNIVGICLDHDMPTEGTVFAQEVLPDYYPVAITSVNTPGSLRIEEILREKKFPHVRRIPALTGPSPSWEEKVLNFFVESHGNPFREI